MSDLLKSDLLNIGQRAKAAAQQLRLASSAQRASAITAMADALPGLEDDILQANASDMEKGREKGLSKAMLDRLELTPKRIAAIAESLRQIAELPNPIGQIDQTFTPPNGLNISRMRVPIGTLGIIYESRPNVTMDAAALCIKSGNCAILRSGSEALQSALALNKAILEGLESAELPKDCVTLIDTPDRAAVGFMLEGLGGAIDLIIPRGGKGLVGRVQAEARVPVLAHLEGICHSYVHAGADPDKARNIVKNAKMRRTGICGSTETLLIDAQIAPSLLPLIAQDLRDLGCELRGDKRARTLVPDMRQATEGDWRTEYLDAILAVRVVDGIDQAMAHISSYGSGHTDAIITEDPNAAARFLSSVDSAIVMHNASTQFADGGEFGFGAEIGIATGRLHARGPVGAAQLTTYKYVVKGNGHVRPG